MVRLYGRNYSVISEKSKSSKLRFYASIESRYGGNRFTVVVRIRNGNFFVAHTVPSEAHNLAQGSSFLEIHTSRKSGEPGS